MLRHATTSMRMARGMIWILLSTDLMLASLSFCSCFFSFLMSFFSLLETLLSLPPAFAASLLRADAVPAVPPHR